MQITLLEKMPRTIIQKAWSLSRDPNKVTEFEAILQVDAPVLEMQAAVLHFEDFTILEREVFTSLRNHVMWARTSRVDDPLEFTVPEEFEPFDKRIYLESMERGRKAGKPQDEWRVSLPLMAHTSWTAQHSLRDLIKLAKYFNYLAVVCASCFVHRFTNISVELGMIVSNLIGEDFDYDNNIKEERFLNEKPVSIMSKPKMEIGGFTFMSVIVPMMLRAQIVRHRPISFIDDLFSSFFKNEETKHKSLASKVCMELMVPTSFWRSISAKRNCWIAQGDLWAPLIKDEETLPCDDGKCPYGEDNKLRLAGKDPNPPCPKWMDLTKQSGIYTDAMVKHAETKSEFWKGYMHVDE